MNCITHPCRAIEPSTLSSGIQMNKTLMLACLSTVAIFSSNPPEVNAQTYTTNPNIGEFTSQVSSYGTLSNFNFGSFAGPTFTPTSAELASDGFYFYNGRPLAGLSGSNWLLVSFSTEVSTILVFPAIDNPTYP